MWKTFSLPISFCFLILQFDTSSMTKYWNKFSLTLKLVRPYSMKKKYHYEKVNREKNVFHRLYILFDKWRKNSSSYIIGHTKKLAVRWWFTWTAVKMWYTAKLRFLHFSILRKKSIYCLNAIRNKVECFSNCTFDNIHIFSFAKHSGWKEAHTFE